ncbi:MAG: WG repeat-containing protein [Crocinitomicaceae bacterium]
MNPKVLIFLVFINTVSFSQDNVSELDHVYPFRGGFALTKMNNHFGIINSKLEIVIPNILDGINNFDLSPWYYDGICYGVIGDSTIYFDTLGNRLKAFGNPNLYPVSVSGYYIDSLRVFGRGQNLGVGLIGGNIIPYDYSYIYKGLEDVLIAVKKFDDYAYDEFDSWTYQRYTRSIMYSRKGDTLSELSGIVVPFKKANCYFSSNDSCCYVLSSSYELQNEINFISARTFGDFAWVLSKEGWGLVNSKFQYVLKPQFSEIHVNQYYTAVKIKDNYAFVNHHGSIISECIYKDDWTQYVGTDSLIAAYTSDDSLHVLNLKGEKLYPSP